ncbi:hypothetical protein [uncultured Methanomethylovorans sp.]|uniref:hypothetical protein n=1 Tax=uncultured Methanomethylovorans sp. TaxID=183759 RepID=UPI002AA8555F|nr:hypothetical protein [uncultured Methanomethylovorans sp.]
MSRQALDTYEKAFEIASDIYLENQEDINVQRHLIDSLDNIVNVLEEMDIFSCVESVIKKEEIFFGKISDVYAKLIAHNSEDIEYITNYSNTMESILDFFVMIGKPEMQITLITNIMKAYETIMRLDPEDPDIPVMLYEMVEQYGKVCLAKESIEEAEQVYGKLEEIYTGILEKGPEDEDMLSLLADSCGLLAALYAKTGEEEKANEYSSKVLDIVGRYCKFPSLNPSSDSTISS